MSVAKNTSATLSIAAKRITAPKTVNVTTSRPSRPITPKPAFASPFDPSSTAPIGRRRTVSASAETAITTNVAPSTSRATSDPTRGIAENRPASRGPAIMPPYRAVSR